MNVSVPSLIKNECKISKGNRNSFEVVFVKDGSRYIYDDKGMPILYVDGPLVEYYNTNNGVTTVSSYYSGEYGRTVEYRGDSEDNFVLVSTDKPFEDTEAFVLPPRFSDFFSRL